MKPKYHPLDDRYDPAQHAAEFGALPNPPTALEFLAFCFFASAALTFITLVFAA